MTEKQTETTMCKASGAADVSGFNPNLDEEYAYKTIEECEEILGYKVNETFRIGWTMARIKNKNLRLLAENSR